MKRQQIISSLQQQKRFKQAVIEMNQLEIGMIEKEIKHHESMLEKGEETIPDASVFEDRELEENPFN